MLLKGDQSLRVKMERKPTLRGKWENVFSGNHMDNVRKETHAVSVMNKPREPWWRSETKRTIVFSCTKLEGKTDWRRGAKSLAGIRQ